MSPYRKTTLIAKIAPVLLFFLGVSGLALAQEASHPNITSEVVAPTQDLQAPRKKGTLYLLWGYNRDAYTKSDIRFVNTKTANYDFTFHDAVAHDKPSVWHWYDLNRLTIPQYDLHIGYMLNDKNDFGI